MLIVRREFFCIYLVLYTILGLIIHQVNIISAYLESLLDDNKFPIYMKPSPGIEKMRQDLYCRLLKSLYNLKQSGHFWNQNVIAFYKKLGFQLLNIDPSILIFQTRDKITIVSIYVNNFSLALNNITALKKLKIELVKKYKVKNLDKVKIIIGWQIIRNLAMRTFKVSQSIYIRDLLKKENLTNCNFSITLIKAGSTIKMNKLDDYKEADLGVY